MKIENSFVVSTPPAVTWPILTDVERIAPCVPGATLGEITDDQAYKGTFKVWLGPVNLTFNGEMRFAERDDDAWTARLTASGREGRNRGMASADVLLSLAPEADGTRVLVETEFQLAGSIAQYGRGAGVIKSVAESLIAQFTECLERNIVAAPKKSTLDTGTAAQIMPEAEALSVFALLIDMIRRAVRRLFGGLA